MSTISIFKYGQRFLVRLLSDVTINKETKRTAKMGNYERITNSCLKTRSTKTKQPIFKNNLPQKLVCSLYETKFDQYLLRIILKLAKLR